MFLRRSFARSAMSGRARFITTSSAKGRFYMPLAAASAAVATVSFVSVACADKPKNAPKSDPPTDKAYVDRSKEGGKKTPPFNLAAVKKDIEALLEDDITQGPILVRLAWHAAGNWDAKNKDGMPNMAAMRFEPECKFAANAGLEKARKILEPIKAKHPKITYADLWVLAGCVAVEAMGGPEVTFRWGRTDATECKSSDGRLPDAAKAQDHVRDVFKRMGFNDQETVALIGAHAVGECHKENSGFVGPWTHDKYGFTNSLFTTLLENDWLLDKTKPLLQFTDLKTKTLMMLPTDICLLYDKDYKKWVDKYAKDEDLFKKDFAKAFQKLLELGCEGKLFDA